MSDVIEIQRLRGDQADKDASTRVLPEGQTAVVLDEAYHVLGDGVTELKDLRPMEDRRIDTVDATSGPLVMTDVSPSIIAADTSGGAAEVELPDLASNQGRKVYVININAEDSIEITAQSGDGIGADGAESITVDASVTTTILIGTPGYWEQVATGGGGATTEFDVITGIYDTGWVANSDWTNAEFTISHNLGRPLHELIVKFFISTDGTDANSTEIRSANSSAAGNDSTGIIYFSIDDSEFKVQTGANGILSLSDTGGLDRIDTDSYYYRVVVYDPNKIAAASSVEKYSTGWVANSDWTNAELLVTHGLDTDLSDLIVRFFISTDGDEDNAFEVAYGTDESGALEHGFTFFQVSSNAIKIQTGADGIRYIDDGGSAVQIDTEAWQYKVVVYKPTFISRELEVTKYDTGWVANSDWTDAEFAITHNLGAALPELIARFFISSDGTDANAIEIISAAFDLASAQTTYRGLSAFATDGNSFSYITGSNGLGYSDANGDPALLGASSPYYYRVVVYKPAMLEAASPAAVRAVSADYQITGRNDSRTINVITGASDQTTTLPDSTATTLIPGDVFTVYNGDSGTGVVTVSRGGSSDTIQGQTTFGIEVQYSGAKFTWLGSFWQVEGIGLAVDLIDGTYEAVYTKSLSGTLDSDSQTSVPHGVADVDKIIDVFAAGYSSGNTRYVFSEFGQGTTGSEVVYFSYDATNVVFGGVGVALQGGVYRVTVRYYV